MHGATSVFNTFHSITLPAVFDCSLSSDIYTKNLTVHPNSRLYHLTNNAAVPSLLPSPSVTSTSAPVIAFGDIDVDVFCWFSRPAEFLEVKYLAQSCHLLMYAILLFAQCQIIKEVRRSWAGCSGPNGKPVKMSGKQLEALDNVPLANQMQLRQKLFTLLDNKQSLPLPLLLPRRQ